MDLRTHCYAVSTMARYCGSQWFIYFHACWSVWFCCLSFQTNQYWRWSETKDSSHHACRRRFTGAFLAIVTVLTAFLRPTIAMTIAMTRNVCFSYVLWPQPMLIDVPRLLVPVITYHWECTEALLACSRHDGNTAIQMGDLNAPTPRYTVSSVLFLDGFLIPVSPLGYITHHYTNQHQPLPRMWDNCCQPSSIIEHSGTVSNYHWPRSIFDQTSLSIVNQQWMNQQLVIKYPVSIIKPLLSLLL